MKNKVNKQNGIVKKQLSDYNNLLKIRVYLQKLNSCIQRWPHPYLHNLATQNLPSDHNNTLNKIQNNFLQLSKLFFLKLSRTGSISLNQDLFHNFDYLPKRRPALLDRLDYLNDITNFNVNRSFKVINNNISTQIKFFHDNPDKFIKKSHILNLPNNIIGYDFLNNKLGAEQSKKLHIDQIYNDQVFYVKLLNYLIQNDNTSDVDLKSEESLIKNNQQDKQRLSLNKTSKGRKVKYTLIEKLENFVERTTNKSFTSPDFTNLLINSLFKS
ncbi:hypothetical protein MACK_002031 [Theileria orientalis]|uniref:Apoptosis-antagonizing transcription factor C-terminal domain-containing protein n=1 Tax=Theileria orientalis TaxID=68886 RepID=A0A976MB45_THEOR|nr:hypothetical protein MACK_002031 [Theileria orientalis]